MFIICPWPPGANVLNLIPGAKMLKSTSNPFFYLFLIHVDYRLDSIQVIPSMDGGHFISVWSHYYCHYLFISLVCTIV